VLENLLRIGRRAIVSFPNFGFWRMRLQQVAVAAADVEHLRAVLDHIGDKAMIAAVAFGPA
jgi:hypothetical protein